MEKTGLLSFHHPPPTIHYLFHPVVKATIRSVTPHGAAFLRPRCPCRKVAATVAAPAARRASTEAPPPTGAAPRPPGRGLAAAPLDPSPTGAAPRPAAG